LYVHAHALQIHSNFATIDIGGNLEFSNHVGKGFANKNSFTSYTFSDLLTSSGLIMTGLKTLIEFLKNAAFSLNAVMASTKSREKDKTK